MAVCSDKACFCNIRPQLTGAPEPGRLLLGSFHRTIVAGTYAFRSQPVLMLEMSRAVGIISHRLASPVVFAFQLRPRGPVPL